MRVAACMIRDLPHYRRAAFVNGLTACGFAVATEPVMQPKPGDALIVWNRYARFEAAAKRYEAAGAQVLVAENGWIGHDEQGRQHYAICRSQHNGAGTWHFETADRWSRLGVPLKPWRRGGKFILLLPQRGIGPEGVAMPLDWPGSILSRLKLATDREIRIRRHPGKEPHPPLEPDLADCYAAVTWGSGAAIKAIAAGIPVFHDMPNWIGAGAAKLGVLDIEDPFLGDRWPMLNRLAWAQWSVKEIESGEPFRCLLT